MVYALLLEDNCYYIGFTKNLLRRLNEHKSGNGSSWTKLHKPIRVLEVIDGGLSQEKKLTVRYATIYGADKVRGADWCFFPPPVNRPDPASEDNHLGSIELPPVIVPKII